MRQGSIRIGDINTETLLLAEFLGMERLLLAIKVRWYCNIGKGPVHNTDDEIAAAFDQEHGGIMKAISSGLYQYFLKQNDVDAEKEFATICISVEAPNSWCNAKNNIEIERGWKVRSRTQNWCCSWRVELSSFERVHTL